MVKIIITLLIPLGIGSTYLYVKGLNYELELAQRDNQTHQYRIAEQQSIITQMIQDTTRIKTLNAELNQVISAQSKDLNNLRSRLTENSAGDPRRIGRIAAQRPVLFQQVINNSSVNAARCIEIASGSALTESEKRDAAANIFNPECSEMISILVK